LGEYEDPLGRLKELFSSFYFPGKSFFGRRHSDINFFGRVSNRIEYRKQVYCEKHVHALLLSPPFIDQSPATIAANLLDQGQYWCSARTMYRILHERAEVRERRRGHRRVHYQKPELLATAPDQVWSWDITKLKGPATWQYFHLYVILACTVVTSWAG
jgi:hypothetical protein